MSVTSKSVVFKLVKRVAFDILLLFGIYLPYGLIVLFASTGYEWNHPYVGGDKPGAGPKLSISTMGWKLGHYWVLIFYVVFVAGFLIYQMRLFSKVSGRKNKILNWITWIGAALLIIGSCLPVDDTLYTPGVKQSWWDLAHSLLCQFGVYMLILAVVLVFVVCCFEIKGDKIRIIIPFCALVFIGSVGLLAFEVASLYEIWYSFACLVFLSYLTLLYEISERHEVKAKRKPKPS